MRDILVIGGGPAGLTAALYARRAGRSVLVLEKAAFGGQIVYAPQVENYPGLPDVSGAELALRLLEQVRGLGAETAQDTVTGLRAEDGAWTVSAGKGEHRARAVILAAGARPRTLGLPREEALTGRGVSYCAVCDGAFFRGKAAAVVGGGNTALQDAAVLAGLCERVYLIFRRGKLRGEARLAEELRARDNVVLLPETRVTALHGEDALRAVTLAGKGGAERRLAVDGLFVAVGREPETGPFAGALDLDPDGCAAAGEDCRTRSPGLFAAGDCRAKPVRQLTTALADGSTAALAACAYLDERKTGTSGK